MMRCLRYVPYVIILVWILILVFYKPKEKTFSGSGVTITLDSSFTEEEVVYSPFCLISIRNL